MPSAWVPVAGPSRAPDGTRAHPPARATSSAGEPTAATRRVSRRGARRRSGRSERPPSPHEGRRRLAIAWVGAFAHFPRPSVRRNCGHQHPGEDAQSCRASELSLQASSGGSDAAPEAASSSRGRSARRTQTVAPPRIVVEIGWEAALRFPPRKKVCAAEVLCCVAATNSRTFPTTRLLRVHRRRTMATRASRPVSSASPARAPASRRSRSREHRAGRDAAFVSPCLSSPPRRETKSAAHVPEESLLDQPFRDPRATVERDEADPVRPPDARCSRSATRPLAGRPVSHCTTPQPPTPLDYRTSACS